MIITPKAAKYMIAWVYIWCLLEETGTPFFPGLDPPVLMYTQNVFSTRPNNRKYRGNVSEVSDRYVTAGK